MEVEVKIETAKPLAEKRDPTTGRFLKGNKFRPPDWNGGGRPRKLDSREILEAITTEFTTDEIRGMIRQAWMVAEKNDDPKMMLEVVRFVAAYGIGKPVQRSIKAEIEPEMFAQLFGGGGGEEDVVDIEAEDA